MTFRTEEGQMTPGQLVKAMAVALDVPEETVVQHDRNLVVAGLRTKGGRGPSAPEVTHLDAARLFVAILGSKRNKDSVATVRAFEDAIRTGRIVSELFRGDAVHRRHIEIDEAYADLSLSRLPDRHNFVEAIVSLITDGIELLKARKFDELEERFGPLTVDCDYPATQASIGRLSEEHEHRINYDGPRIRDPDFVAPIRLDSAGISSLQSTGIYQQWTAWGSAIVLIARAFCENGLPFKTASEAIRDLLKSPGDESKKQRRKKRSPT
jgi:hypothetical protein